MLVLQRVRMVGHDAFFERQLRVAHSSGRLWRRHRGGPLAPARPTHVKVAPLAAPEAMTVARPAQVCNSKQESAVAHTQRAPRYTVHTHRRSSRRRRAGSSARAGGRARCLLRAPAASSRSSPRSPLLPRVSPPRQSTHRKSQSRSLRSSESGGRHCGRSSLRSTAAHGTGRVDVRTAGVPVPQPSLTTAVSHSGDLLERVRVCVDDASNSARHCCGHCTQHTHHTTHHTTQIKNSRNKKKSCSPYQQRPGFKSRQYNAVEGAHCEIFGADCVSETKCSA